jgi:hypothetical protein
LVTCIAKRIYKCWLLVICIVQVLKVKKGGEGNSMPPVPLDLDNIACYFQLLKGIQAVRIFIFFILKVAYIRCFLLIFHNIIVNSLERRKYVAVWFSCIQ